MSDWEFNGMGDEQKRLLAKVEDERRRARTREAVYHEACGIYMTRLERMKDPTEAEMDTARRLSSRDAADLYDKCGEYLP